MTFVLNFPTSGAHWVEVLTALAAPVAMLVALLTLWGQWVLLKHQQKREMFEKRFAIYSKVREFIGEIARTLRVDSIQECARFLYDTKGSEFLFEPPVEAFIQEVYRNATALHGVNVVLAGPQVHQREEQVRRQQELEQWLSEDAHKLAATTFSPYLTLYQEGFWKTALGR
jgi:hypothetical protein